MYSWWGKIVLGFVVSFAIFLIMVIFFLIGSLPLQFMREAELVNAKYNTEYSAWDMFLAGSTIRENIVGRKQNINLE